ncbi:MAG TPA: hypothetical protein VGQ08_11725 [Nitrospiraceae bacterium]|nr:hypothetical protein [Nitrospiraceae bacterium]
MFRHFLVIHTMFEDVFDFMPPFFGLFWLIQRFVIENLDQIVGRTLHRFGRARFSPVWCGGGIEGDAIVSPATIPKRNNRCASFVIITLMMVVA